MGAGLLLAFNLTHRLFEAGVFPRSPRVAIEPDIPEKLLWGLRESLPNALALFAINDAYGRNVMLHAGSMLLVLTLLLGGVIWVMRRQGVVRALWWLVCLAALPLAAYRCQHSRHGTLGQLPDAVCLRRGGANSRPDHARLVDCWNPIGAGCVWGCWPA